MTSAPVIEIDGAPADLAALRAVLLGGYGHFTAMQVRDGRTRGLDLHLRRLDAGNRELFGGGSTASGSAGTSGTPSATPPTPPCGCTPTTRP
jgi:hypothetical protein